MKTKHWFTVTIEGEFVRALAYFGNYKKARRLAMYQFNKEKLMIPEAKVTYEKQTID